MNITKEEIVKIKSLQKILECNFDEKEIRETNANLIIDSDSITVIVNEKNLRTQMVLRITDGLSERKCFETPLVTILELAKVFTKKADISIEIQEDKILFKGLQGKEECSVELPTFEVNVNKKNLSTSTLDTTCLLTAFNCFSKVVRDIPQVACESLIEIVERHHKVSMSMYTDIELCSFSQITDNEDRSASVFITKEDLKLITESIKAIKSLEIGFGIDENNVFISGNGIDVTIHIKSKEGISVSSLIDSLERKANFIPKKFTGAEIDMKLQKEELHFKKSGDETFCLSNAETKVPITYSYKINKILRISDFDIIYYDQRMGIIKLSFDGTNYYLMPKKKNS